VRTIAPRQAAKLHFLFGLLLNRRSGYVPPKLGPFETDRERRSGSRAPHASRSVDANIECLGSKMIWRKSGKELWGFLTVDHGIFMGFKIDAMADDLIADTAR